jgi:cytochrome P450 family 6
MTFFTYELALNPDIQERLRDEINEVLSRHDGEVTYDAIMEMKYLDMAFNETLRKYPVADFNSRKPSSDFKIPNSNLVIPAGVQIMIPSYALQRDPQYFPEPEKFDPERFLPENIKKRSPYVYLPFSEGPRICIGMRFGMMQTKIGIVKLLQNYRFSTCKKTTIPMKFVPSGNVLTPMNGMWLTIECI